jgi:hypothetical protein
MSDDQLPIADWTQEKEWLVCSGCRRLHDADTGGYDPEILRCETCGGGFVMRVQKVPEEVR